MGEVSGAEVLRERRMLLLNGFVHLPSYVAVTEVALGTTAEFRDVEGFGEVHLEEASNSRREREKILRGLCCLRRAAGGDGLAGSEGGFNLRLVFA